MLKIIDSSCHCAVADRATTALRPGLRSMCSLALTSMSIPHIGDITITRPQHQNMSRARLDGIFENKTLKLHTTGIAASHRRRRREKR
jgi:hypothetical protein